MREKCKEINFTTESMASEAVIKFKSEVVQIPMIFETRIQLLYKLCTILYYLS